MSSHGSQTQLPIPGPLAWTGERHNACLHGAARRTVPANDYAPVGAGLPFAPQPPNCRWSSGYQPVPCDRGVAIRCPFNLPFASTAQPHSPSSPYVLTPPKEGRNCWTVPGPVDGGDL